VNRQEFQVLAETRLVEAQVLFRNDRFDGAYYLAGYVIECALKACIAKRTRQDEFPDKEFARKVWTHDLEKLLDATDIVIEGSESKLKWNVVKDWSENCRYQTHDAKKARDMLDAVSDVQHGVLQCLKRYW